MVFDVRQKLNVAAALVNRTSGGARKNVADVTFRIINDPVHLDDRHSISLNYDGEDFYDSLATVLHLAVSEAPEDDIDILVVVEKDGGDVKFDTNNFNEKFMEVYESEFQKEFSLSLVDEYTLCLVNDKKVLDVVSKDIRKDITGDKEYDEKKESKSPMIDVTGELDMDRLIKSNKDWRFKMPFYARKRMSVDGGIHEEEVNEVGICDEFNQLKQYGFRKYCSRHHLRNIVRFIKKNTEKDNFIVGKNDVDIKAMKILQYYINNSNVGYYGLDECVGFDVFLDYLRLSGAAVVKDKVATKAAAEVVVGGIRQVHGYDNRLLVMNAAMHSEENFNATAQWTEEVGMVIDVMRKDTSEQLTQYENLSIDVLSLSYKGDIAVDSLRALFRLTNGAILFDYASPSIKNASAFHHIIKTLTSKQTTVEYMLSTINENFSKYNNPVRMGVLGALVNADPEMNCHVVIVRELNTYIAMEKTHKLDLATFEDGAHTNAKWFSAVIRLCDYAVHHNYPIINMSNDSFSKLTDRIKSRDCKGIDDKYIRILAKVMSNRDEDDYSFTNGLKMIFCKGISDRLGDIFNTSLFMDFIVHNRMRRYRYNVEAVNTCRLFEQYKKQDWHCIDSLVGPELYLGGVDAYFDKVYDNGTICPTVLQTTPNLVTRSSITIAVCLKIFKNCKEARNMVFFPDWFIKEHAKELFDAVTNAEDLTMQNKAIGYIRIMNAIGLNAAEELGRLPVAEIIECDAYHIFTENAKDMLSVITSPRLDFYERYLDVALMDKEHELNVGLNIGYHTAFFVDEWRVHDIINRILDTGIFDTETKAKTIYMMIAGFEACVKIEKKLHGLDKIIQQTEFFAMRSKIARVCLNLEKPAEEGLWASRLHIKFLTEGLIG